MEIKMSYEEFLKIKGNPLFKEKFNELEAKVKVIESNVDQFDIEKIKGFYGNKKEYSSNDIIKIQMKVREKLIEDFSSSDLMELEGYKGLIEDYKKYFVEKRTDKTNIVYNQNFPIEKEFTDEHVDKARRWEYIEFIQFINNQESILRPQEEPAPLQPLKNNPYDEQ